MRTILMAFFILIIQASCSSVNQKKDQKEGNEPVKVMIPESGCFVAVSKQDTVWLKLEIFPKVVTGILKYNFSEKDNSSGTLEGKLVADKILAEYTYTSEGKTSVREVSFLLAGNTATEGLGEMEERNGKMVFKNKEGIDFTGGLKFSSIDCAENDTRFQLNR